MLKILPVGDKDCNLVIDGMAIRKQLIWDGSLNFFRGYCDYGNNIPIEGTETVAKEVLVFLLVNLKGKWKWPIAYFFVHNLNAKIQAQLIQIALDLSDEFNMRVWGITLDGAKTNMSTLEVLGCSFNTNKMELKTISFILKQVEKYMLFQMRVTC